MYKWVYLILFITPPLYSISLSEIVDSIKSKEQLFHKQEVKRLSTLRKLNEIIDQIKKVNKEIQHTEHHTDRSKKSLSSLNRLIEQLNKKIEDKEKHTKEIKQISSHKKDNLFRILYPWKSRLETIGNHNSNQEIKNNSFKLLETYKNNKNLFKKSFRKQEKNMNQFVALKKDLLKKKAQLEKHKSKNLSRIKTINTKRSLALKKLKDIKIKYMQMMEKNKYSTHQLRTLKQFLKDSFFERQGHLGYPLNGSIIRKIHYQNTGLGLPLKGLFFKSPLSQPVKSIFKGDVQFAGPVKTFGKSIIIDHGHNYFSIYGNNKKLLVSKGDTVEEGETLALSGHVGPFFGSGSYFEIRYLSEPLDPKKWINKKTKFNSRDLL